jgi:hypothetical protein
MNYSTALFIAILILIFCKNIISQDERYYPSNHEAVEISIQLNKEKYLPYEPILINLQLKNISEAPQQLGPLGFFSQNLRYHVIKDSSILERYFLWKESYSTGWFESKETATPPQEQKTHQVVINHFLNLESNIGEYVFELGYPIQGEVRKGVVGVVGYKTKKENFTIQKVPTRDTAALNIYKPNFEKIMAGLNFTQKELQGDSAIHAFNRIIKNYPDSYLTEPSFFYKAFYFLQKFTVTNNIEDIRKAKQLFIEFKKKYPKTVYLGLVKEYLRSCNALLNQ